MTVRIFKHDRNELLKQGIEIISSTNDTKYHNRVVLVNLLLTGKISISLMSKASGLTTRTLSNWLSIVDNEGFEKLRAIKQSGRPDKLSDEQKAEIKKYCERVLINTVTVFGTVSRCQTILRQSMTSNIA